MTEFTKERLISEIEMLEHFAGNVKWISEKGEQSLLFAADAMRKLLAGMEQRPVYQVRHGDQWRDLNRAQYDDHVNLGAEGRIVYAAPQLPQPVVSVELLAAMEEVLRISDREHDAWNRAKKGIADCRAAMLQGAEPVSQPYTLREGWAAVPVEPTEDMVIAGFEAELREEFRDPEAWEAFEAMSGCEQAAHRAKLCWAAMIAAVPHQETKI